MCSFSSAHQTCWRYCLWERQVVPFSCRRPSHPDVSDEKQTKNSSRDSILAYSRPRLLLKLLPAVNESNRQHATLLTERCSAVWASQRNRSLPVCSGLIVLDMALRSSCEHRQQQGLTNWISLPLPLTALNAPNQEEAGVLPSSVSKRIEHPFRATPRKVDTPVWLILVTKEIKAVLNR